MASFLYLISFLPEADYNSLTTPHVTVVGEFSLPDQNLKHFTHALEVLLPDLPAVHLDFSGKDYYGDNLDIPVLTYHKNNKLMLLHNTLVELIFSYKGTLKRPHQALQNFSPHKSFNIEETPWDIPTVTLIHHTNGFMNEVQVLGEYALKGIPE